MVTLENTSRNRSFIATLYPDIVGRRSEGRKLYAVCKVRSPSGKVVGQKQPFSFEILPGKTAAVDPAALHLPQVKAARKSGWLVLVAAPPVEAKASKPASTTPALVDTVDDDSGSTTGRRKRS
jgi:hypothetical protein